MINVTKTYLPNKEKYKAYIDRIYESGWLTNNGPLLQELEQRLADYLGVNNLILVANGSLALQLAYKALDLKGEVITTPFSFVATTSTLVWEGLKPVFADIDSETFNLNPKNIESLITKQTSAIVPVHVFGNPCEVEKIQAIADKHSLKVVYDAAHAFGSEYKGKSVLNYGDISTLSFHATKLFHTIEGGAVITNDDTLAKKIRLLINFGITGPDCIGSVGTNAKMNEFEAAMGLCVLDEMETIKQKRTEVWQNYSQKIMGLVTFQQWNANSQNNCAYAPVLFESEEQLITVEAKLKDNQIVPRRYFYPSLDTLDYLQSEQVCDVSRDIASRILCLPIYPELNVEQTENIVQGIKSCVIISKKDERVNETAILNFFANIDQDFSPKLSDQTPLKDYVQKIYNLAEVDCLLIGDERIIALIAYYLNTDTQTCYITVLGVEASFRGKGLSKQLLSNCIKMAEKNDMIKLKLRASKNHIAALNLYKANGFIISNEVSANSNKVYLQRDI